MDAGARATQEQLPRATPGAKAECAVVTSKLLKLLTLISQKNPIVNSYPRNRVFGIPKLRYSTEL